LEDGMKMMVRIALIAFVVAGSISFVLNFVMAARGAHPGFETRLIAMVIGLSVSLVVWNLSGNRKVAAADAGQRAQALSFAPPEGRALLYFIRTGFVGRAAGMNISVDGEERAHIKAPQFTCVEVAPGTHAILAGLAGGAGAQSNPQSATVTVQPGEASALLFTLKMGAIKGNIVIENLSADKAKGIISGMKMVVPLER
jgi:hypothetical protein